MSRKGSPFAGKSEINNLVEDITIFISNLNLTVISITIEKIKIEGEMKIK